LHEAKIGVVVRADVQAWAMLPASEREVKQSTKSHDLLAFASFATTVHHDLDQQLELELTEN
jgi:hypothetical protein